MFVRFFIDRPIFATVLSTVLVLAGSLAVGTLPLSQYPPVTPPTIQVDCNYPGASADVVAQTIAAPIEQQVNGVERMLYMTSQSTSDGSYTLTVTFEIGTNLNLAQVLVQNRVNLALPNLPDVVQATGVTTRKRSAEILLTVSLNSPNNTYNQLYLSNYAFTHIKDELARLPGISDVTLFGQRDYAIRVWLNPDKLAMLNLSATDITKAISEQNAQIPAGHIGQPPTTSGQTLEFPLTALGRLQTPEQFEQIVVKTTSDHRMVRLRDVAKVELGARLQDVSMAFNRKPTVGLAIFLLTGANSLEVGDAVKKEMKRLKEHFPPDITYDVGYDTTPFIRQSIREVFNSLRSAIILVAIVVLVFLQSWRASLIPLAAVPVAIIGTFAVMWSLGYTLNNLTLFGLVLAVGIVVDDAIVVVEAVQHHIERGLAPREATIQAMSEVTGPIIAVAAVLSAVFVPCVFLSGIVGQFFKQFAVTIAVSTLISAFNSLTLSPALAALLLRSPNSRRDPATWLIDNTLGWFFRIFNWGFDLSGRAYVKIVRMAIRVPVALLVVYAGLTITGAWGYQQLPSGFIPLQDKGYLIASVALPDGASAERCKAVLDHIAKIAMETPGVHYVNAVSGNSFVVSAYGSHFGSMFIILDEFADRRKPELYSDVIMAGLRKRLKEEVPEAQSVVFGPSAVSGLGRTGGFRVMIEDRAGVGPQMLQGQTDNLIERAKKQPGLKSLMTVYKTNSPQIFLEVDRTSCFRHGVVLQEVFSVLQATMGSRYVNDMNMFGRTWQVDVQAEAQYRNKLEDIRKIRVHNNRGQMVPLGSLLTVKDVPGPLVITRHNMYPAASINGDIAAGTSTGDGYAIFERLSDKELPAGRMAFEWSELAYIETQAKDTGIFIFALAVAFVFLVLAALYESWALPLAVILVVPMCVVGSLAAVAYSHQDVNIFTEVGFVVLIGLACKNAILIIEFAKLARDEGVDRRTAVISACKLRFRPIIMTSFSFILGVVPLLAATGAGAEMRKALGTAVFGGMLGVTFFGIVLTPVFFVVVDWVVGSELFRNRYVQLFGKGLLMLLTLGFLVPCLRHGVNLASSNLASRAERKLKRVPMTLSTNGTSINGTHVVKKLPERDEEGPTEMETRVPVAKE